MSPLSSLVYEVEFVEIVLSALPWHSRGTVIKEAHLLPSGPQGIHVALRELRPLRGHPSPPPRPGFLSLLFSLKELKFCFLRRLKKFSCGRSDGTL